MAKGTRKSEKTRADGAGGDRSEASATALAKRSKRTAKEMKAVRRACPCTRACPLAAQCIKALKEEIRASGAYGARGRQQHTL